MNRDNLNRVPSKAADYEADKTAMKSKIAVNHKLIGQRIREERERLALSRAEFAEIIGLSDFYIGQLERGERQMSLGVMLKIAACLHMSLDYLMLGSTRYSDLSESEAVSISVNDNSQGTEIRRLLEKCSDKELELIKKIIQITIPYIR